MARRGRRTLAIHPGTREMGIAVLEGGRLIYHAVEVLRHAPARRKVLAAGAARFRRYVRDFRPAVVAIEVSPFATRQKSVLHALATLIATIAKREKVRTVQFASSTVKSRICRNGYADKAEVAKTIAARFPELKAYLRQDRKWKDRFQSNRFDAIALALFAKETLRKSTAKKCGTAR
ncbi:MAG: hypothetical protein C5B51_14720 [Terriglobia bacterium]|nr:MAG: hypothetical protein C5B51_14720 [Terriglobia bacterium]